MTNHTGEPEGHCGRVALMVKFYKEERYAEAFRRGQLYARSLRPRTDLAAFQHDQIQYMVVWNPQSHYILWHIGGGSFCRADS